MPASHIRIVTRLAHAALFSAALIYSSPAHPQAQGRQPPIVYMVAERAVDIAKTHLKESKHVYSHIERNLYGSGIDYLMMVADRDGNGCPEVRVALPLKGVETLEDHIRVELNPRLPMQIFVNLNNNSADPGQKGIHVTYTSQNNYVLNSSADQSKNTLFRPVDTKVKCL